MKKNVVQKIENWRWTKFNLPIYKGLYNENQQTRYILWLMKIYTNMYFQETDDEAIYNNNTIQTQRITATIEDINNLKMWMNKLICYLWSPSLGRELAREPVKPTPRARKPVFSRRLDISSKIKSHQMNKWQFQYNIESNHLSLPRIGGSILK